MMGSNIQAGIAEFNDVEIRKEPNQPAPSFNINAAKPETKPIKPASIMAKRFGVVGYKILETRTETSLEIEMRHIISHQLTVIS